MLLHPHSWAPHVFPLHLVFCETITPSMPWTSQKAVIMLWGEVSSPLLDFSQFCKFFWQNNKNLSCLGDVLTMLINLPSNFRALPSNFRATSEHFRALSSTSEQLPSNFRATSEHFQALPSNFRATSEHFRGPWERELWRNSGLEGMPVGKTLLLKENYQK